MRRNKAVAEDIQQLNTNNDIAAALWINFREDPAQSFYPLHGHAWGEFIYAFNGMMEVKIGQIDYITPPLYGIWLPPNVQHSGLNRTDISHATFYIHESLCVGLANQPGILLTNPLVSSLLQHLKQYPTEVSSGEHQRLLYVLLDQLKQAQVMGSYLPHSQHPQLRHILDYLHQHPEDNSTLQHLAARHHLTERTLARYCQKELRMSLNEWRQRLKVINAMSMLKQQISVENIAFDLGYANASAFIQMFKRWMGYTPDQFRKMHQVNQRF